MGCSPRTATILLIFLTTLLRVVWAASLDALNDEAYHWQFVVHPAFSYFDHPPMTAWVTGLGIAMCGGWVDPVSLRLGFILLFAGACWILYRWTARWYGELAGFWAVVGLSLSHYYTAFGGMMAVPDSPLLFFSLLTFWQLGEAIRFRNLTPLLNLPPLRHGEGEPDSPALWTRGHLSRWLLVGVGLGGALLSKYHAVLIPLSVVVYAVITPGTRRLLWSSGPWLAVFVALLMFSPVIVWNAENDWASFKFQGGRASRAGGSLFHEGPLKWLFGPMLFLLPWFWFWLVYGLVARLRHFRSLEGIDRLIVVLSVVPLVFFLITSFMSPLALPHWAIIGYVPLYPLAGATWVRVRNWSAKWFRIMVACWVAMEAVILVAIYLQASEGVLNLPPGVVDETRQFSGWRSVAANLDERGLLNDSNAFLFTDNWETAGQLAFAIRNRIPVTCYHTFDARGFSFWSKPTDYLGRTGYMVLVDGPEEVETQREFGPYFERVVLIAEFPMTRSGKPFRQMKVYRCERQIKPYPFHYTLRK